MTPEEIKLLEDNKIIPPNCPLQQVKFFEKVCAIKKLDPFTRQIHLVERNEKGFNGEWKKSYTIQAGIDGMRAIAQRNAKIKSYKRWVDKREDDLYGICEIDTEDRGIYRDELPFNEYKQTKKDGTLNSFWAKFPQTMIKKCAEESVLRMMTPEDLSGVYGDDEMLQADTEEVKALPEKIDIKKEVEEILANPPVINTRNYFDEVRDFKTGEQIKEWWNSLGEDEKKKAWDARHKAEVRLTKANIEKIIDGLKTNTWEKNQTTVLDAIDESEPERRSVLKGKLEARLKHLGIEFEYPELPF